MEKLPSSSPIAIIFMLLLFFTAINQTSSARNLPNHHIHNHGHNRITFLMPDMLNVTVPMPSSEETANTKDNGQFPFSKPLGYFPPNGGIPIPQYSTTPTIPSSTQTLDLSNFGFSFPTRATLQELEFGSVTAIDEELLREEGDAMQKLGRAQGVYVASSEDGSSHMMAITASFVKGEYEEDGLRIFGVHRSDVIESHVAVIGGSGKYFGANGYAAVKVVDRVGSSTEQGKVITSKFLLFDVYLS